METKEELKVRFIKKYDSYIEEALTINDQERAKELGERKRKIIVWIERFGEEPPDSWYDLGGIWIA